MGRLLAFLVTDLVGSTEVLSRLGESRAESLQRTYVGMLRSAIAAADGDELKSFGDGVMASFPTASQAVACAAAMQRAFVRHNARGGERLDVRIGLDVGEAADEPERLDREGFFGRAAVRAKRLCDAALGGQILVSDLVAALGSGRGGYSFSPAGLVQLKGFPEPVTTFAVAYERTAAERPALPPELATQPVSASPFVGRGGERDRLLRLWSDVERGRRGLAFVTGEPGIGKTRLTAEYALDVYSRGGVVLWGRSFEEGLVPYQPFVQALRHYLLECDPDELRLQLAVGAAELARLVPELEARLRPMSSVQEEIEGGRYRLFEAVAALLADIAAAHPLLLVLDDLQWADQATLLLLKHVAVDPRPASLLVLGTYRDSEVPRAHPLAQLQADVERDSAIERIELGGLPAGEVATLVASLIGGAPPEELLSTLQSETDGNPFFVEELVRDLEATGLVANPERLGTEGVAVPARVKELVARRLQRLSPKAFETLRVASVIGSEFGIELLASVVAEPEDELVQVLDEGVASRLIVEAPSRLGRYGFSHALVQQALYEEQTANWRASVHGRIAGALESCGPDPAPFAAELAHHFASFGRAPEKVVRCGRAAGKQALVVLAYEDATREFSRALDTLAAVRPEDHAERAELLVLLGTAQTRAGDAPAARASFRQAAELAAKIGSPETLARAALGYGGTAGFGGVWVKFADIDAELVHFLEEGLRQCSGGDNPTRVRLLGRLAQALYWSPDGGRAEGLSREALESARRLGDKAALAHALDSRHVVLWGPDHLAERTALALEMLRLGEELADRDITLEAYAWLITNALASEPIEVVDAYIDAHSRVARELRQPYHLWYTEVTRAMRAHLEGRFEEAGRLAETAWGYGEQAHGENARQTYLVQTLFLSLDLGRLEELVDGLAGYVAVSPLAAWHAALGLAHAGLDQREQALAEVERFASDGFETIPRDCIWMATMCMLARVVARFDAEEHAEPLYQLLRPFAERRCVVGGAVLCLGPISYFLGRLARVLGEHDLALEHLDQALAASRALRAPPLVARTQVETARVLLARSAGGDVGRARALLDQAAGGARAAGMAKLHADAAGILSAAQRPMAVIKR